MDRFTPNRSHPRRLVPRERAGVRPVSSPRILLATPSRQRDYRRSVSRVRRSRDGNLAPPTSVSNSLAVGAPPVSAEEIQLYLNPGRDEKCKLEKILRSNSVVYNKKYQALPKIYQHTQKFRHRVNQSYPFASPKGQERFPTLTTKLPSEPRIPTPHPQTPVSGETTASTTSTSLPSLPRTPCCNLLLRRPITFSPRPLEEQDAGFQAFANRLDLKPLVINDSPAQTLKFYTFHYPLLLQKLLDEDRDKYVDRRSITPSLGPDRRKRGLEVKNRVQILDTELEELAKQTDGKFYTELRDDTFNPRKWHWNWNRYH